MIRSQREAAVERVAPATRGLLLGSLLALSLVIAACTRADPPDVLLIVVDTLRVDRLGAYGNERGLTPFLDSLAERSYVFQNAFAQSSWTSPSVASLLTSRFQSQHGVLHFRSVLADAEVTLPELLKQRGYATAGFCANWLIANNRGFGQGYDEYEVPGDPPQPVRAAELNRRALAWLESLPRDPRPPAFLYLHYMEPHGPYTPDEFALDQVFEARRRPSTAATKRILFLNRLKTRMDRNEDEAIDGKRALRRIQDLYDAEILSVDRGLGALLSELGERGLLQNTLVVFTSDHGEEFLDHGWFGHSQSLYDELIHVPLFIHVPGQSERIDVEQVVSLIDVAPTILEWLRGEPAASFEGHSLGPLMQSAGGGMPGVPRHERPGHDAGEPFAISELVHGLGKRVTPHQVAIVMDSGKLIAGLHGEREFYDRAADPGEREPTSLADRERQQLEAALHSFASDVNRSTGPRRTRPLDKITRQQLRALGYAE